MGTTRTAGTSREPEEWAKATGEARQTREELACEIAERIGVQVAELLISGDIMGGRALVAMRTRQVIEAERREDRGALRSAVVDLAVAAAAWAAGLDHEDPVLLPRAFAQTA